MNIYIMALEMDAPGWWLNWVYSREVITLPIIIGFVELSLVAMEANGGSNFKPVSQYLAPPWQNNIIQQAQN